MLGEDTELDKTVADGLVDPLVHILRNSVDHGVESAEARRQAGKPETGSVRVEARREGNGVLIEVSDDGQGIDPTRIRRAAISKGLITEDAGARLSDTESLDLIFAAGLSTAAEITDVSGRGVGMDVVKSNIVRMGGVVSVSSEIGKGTTIRLQLPLTLSVFRAMLVNAGGEAFALPLEAIRETASLSGWCRSPTRLACVGTRVPQSKRARICSSSSSTAAASVSGWSSMLSNNPRKSWSSPSRRISQQAVPFRAPRSWAMGALPSCSNPSRPLRLPLPTPNRWQRSAKLHE
jgi:hypothetical protein